MKSSRRVALKVLASTGASLPAGVLAQRRALAAAGPKAFTAKSFATLEAAAERILPADESSPGAREALVAPVLDAHAARGDEARRARWQAGLAALDARAAARGGTSFAALAPADQDALLTELAAHEAAPQTDPQRFFVELKREIVRAYYATEIGLLRELGYEGNRRRARFDGCTHPEHRGRAGEGRGARD
jgi:hypothetical protein